MGKDTRDNEIVFYVNKNTRQMKDQPSIPITSYLSETMTGTEEPTTYNPLMPSLGAIWQAPTLEEKTVRINEYLELSLKTESIKNQLIKIRSQIDKLEISISEITEKLPSFHCHSTKLSLLPSEKWRLKEPINITIEENGESNYTACFYEANLYGYVDSIPECINDLSDAILNQVEHLSDEKQKYELGPMPHRQFEILKQVITKR